MYCQNCGKKLIDDAKFCYACGAKVIIPAEDEKPINDVPQTKEQKHHEETDPFDVWTETARKKTNKNENGKSIKDSNRDSGSYYDIKSNRYYGDADKKDKHGHGIAIMIVVIIVIGVLSMVAYWYYNNTICRIKGCNNKRVTNSEYCKQHVCQYPNCVSKRTGNSMYCGIHDAALLCHKWNCYNERVKGGEYCIEHTCKVDGCFKEADWDGNYCFEHRNADKVDMREYLKDVSFRFKLNSAGGIVFTFTAKNNSPKEIKYVKFKAYLYNAVDDSINDDIKGQPYIDVSITGPVRRYGTVSMSDEIIGYCDECTRIDINDVTIEYTDGTSDNGRLGYYTENKKR